MAGLASTLYQRCPPFIGTRLPFIRHQISTVYYQYVWFLPESSYKPAFMYLSSGQISAKSALPSKTERRKTAYGSRKPLGK